MAKKEEINLNLPSVDDLFTTQKERDEEKLKKIYEIPLEVVELNDKKICIIKNGELE